MPIGPGKGAYKCQKNVTFTEEDFESADIRIVGDATIQDGNFDPDELADAANEYCQQVFEIDAIDTATDALESYAEKMQLHVPALNKGIQEAVKTYYDFDFEFGSTADLDFDTNAPNINTLIGRQRQMVEILGSGKKYGYFFKDYDTNDQLNAKKNDIQLHIFHLLSFINHINYDVDSENSNSVVVKKFNRDTAVGTDKDVRTVASGPTVQQLHVIAAKATNIYSLFSFGREFVVGPNNEFNLLHTKTGDGVLEPVEVFSASRIKQIYQNSAYKKRAKIVRDFDQGTDEDDVEALKNMYYKRWNIFTGTSQEFFMGTDKNLIFDKNKWQYSSYEWLTYGEKVGADGSTFYNQSPPGLFYDDAIRLTTELAVEYASQRKLELSRYVERINDLIATLQNIIENNIEPHLKGIIQANLDYVDEMDEIMLDLELARNDLYKEFSSQFGGKRKYFRDSGLETIYNSLVTNVSNPQHRLRTAEGQTNSYYRENPEKLFYKEQCYLLSYISQIAGHKKENIDSVELYATNAAQSTRGTNPVREAFMAGNFDDIGEGSRKRTPYTTSLLQKNTEDFRWNGNASILLDGDPYAFINKLAISKNLGPLINIENDILSYLQPYVRLYKVIYDKNGEEREVEITFEPTFNEFEKNLFNSRRVRNTGVGLKNFSFTYDGSNPFGAKKSIKAKLHIFSNSFDELMICRGSGKCDDIDDDGFVSSYRYVDLALKTFNNNNKNIKFGSVYRENDELAKLNFRLKAQVGYSMPSNFGRITGDQKRELQKALRDSRVTLNLIPTVHDFQFDELGRVNFSINYLAFVEDLFSQAKFNVFSEVYASRDRIVRNASLKYYQKTCRADAVRTIKEEYAERATEEISNSISNLITLMMDRDKISYVEISMDQIKDYISFGPFSEKNINSKIKISSDKGYFERMKKNIDECLELFKERRASIDTDDQQKITASLATIDSSVEVLSFFYVSDLIDIVLENIERELDQMPDLLREYKTNNITSVAAQSDEIDEKIDEYQKNTKAFQKTRYLLGPVEFVSPNDNQSFFVNLGDIPISLKYFFEWLTSTMLDRDDSFYSLSRFMNEFFNDFIQKFLNNDRCFDYSIKQRTKLNQATLLGTKAQNSDLDKITNLMIEKRNPRLNIDDGEVKSSLPLIHSYGLASNSENSRITASDEINYMTYFVGRTMPTERMRGIRSEDEELGVFHYQIGRDRGLVKNIELTKTQTPGLQEVRFEQQGYDGLEQLRVVYDAKIECFSNVNTFPGTYIYIDPAGYAPRSHPTQIDLTKYGVGGYYMIVRSTHTFGPGIANSDIEAKWVNELYDPDKPQPQYIKETTSTEDPKNLKCTAHVERETKAKEK